MADVSRLTWRMLGPLAEAEAVVIEVVAAVDTVVVVVDTAVVVVVTVVVVVDGDPIDQPRCER